MTAVAQSNPGEFSQLVEELVELENQRSVSGADGERADERARIERRLMHLLCTDVAADERRRSIRVPTNLSVVVRSARSEARGTLTNVGVGGAFIEVALPAQVGDEVAVVVDRARGALEHGFHLLGRVAWLSAADGRRVAGFGVAFSAAADTDARRLRHLVIDLLREHAPRA